MRGDEYISSFLWPCSLYHLRLLSSSYWPCMIINVRSLSLSLSPHRDEQTSLLSVCAQLQTGVPTEERLHPELLVQTSRVSLETGTGETAQQTDRERSVFRSFLFLSFFLSVYVFLHTGLVNHCHQGNLRWEEKWKRQRMKGWHRSEVTTGHLRPLRWNGMMGHLMWQSWTFSWTRRKRHSVTRTMSEVSLCVSKSQFGFRKSWQWIRARTTYLND